MTFLNNKKAFTLVEMLITLVVASIIVLTIGAMSSISLSSHKRTRQEAAMFADVSYAMKFIKNRVREADTLTSDTTPPAPWIAPRLIIDNESAIGLYNVADPATRTELIFMEDKDADPDVQANKTVLFYVDDAEDKDPTDNDIILNLLPEPPAVPDKTITIDLVGVKNGIPFSFTDTGLGEETAVTVKRRAQ